MSPISQILVISSFSESDTSFIPTTASKIDKMSANKELEALIQRLESVATRLEKTQGGGSAVEGKSTIK